MVRWWVFNKEIDVSKAYLMVTIIMYRSVNPTGDSQIKLSKDQINTWWAVSNNVCHRIYHLGITASWND